MEKPLTNFTWEQDVKKNIEVDENKPLNTKILNSIEVPDLTFRDTLRILKSKHVKIY